jgi:hypothetical protein
MKNAYLLAPALLTGVLAFGQVQKDIPARDADNSLEIGTALKVNKSSFEFGKAGGDVLFSSDFNGALTGFTVDPSTQDSLWKFDTDGPSGQYSSATNADIINSTTAANGFAIMDGDFASPGAAPYNDKVAKLTSTTIDLTGIPGAVLVFQQRYRSCCTADWFPKVDVSTNNFATFASYNAASPGMATNTDIGTFTQKISFKSFMDTASNLDNFKFRFSFDGAGGTSHYYWQIDDVLLHESYDYDVRNTSTKFFSGPQEIPYYNVPFSQITDVTFTSIVRNDGLMAFNPAVDVVIDNGGGTHSSPALTLAAGTQDTLYTTTWLPTATATMTYSFGATVDDATNADQNTWDNTAMDAMNITDGLYSVDNGIAVSSIGNFGGNANQPFKIGNIMDIMADRDIIGLEIQITTSATNVGQIISGEIQIYDEATESYIYLTETDEVTITAGNNGSAIQFTLIDINVPVAAGADLLVLARHNGSTTSDVRFSTAQKVRQGTVIGYSANGDAGSLTNPGAIMVRLLLDETAGMKEATNDFTFGLFPNPTASSAELNYRLDGASMVNVSVTDLSGKAVYTTGNAMKAAGGNTLQLDLSDFNSGVYFVTVATENSVVTKKLVRK